MGSAVARCHAAGFMGSSCAVYGQQLVKTRWWSLFTFLDSFMFNIKTLRYMHYCPKHPAVPPELYNLTDLLIGDLECAREVAQ